MGPGGTEGIFWSCWLWWVCHFWLQRVSGLESMWPHWPKPGRCVWKLKSLLKGRVPQKHTHKKNIVGVNFFYFPVVWQSLKALGLKPTHVEVKGRRGWKESWRKWGRESVKVTMLSVCIIFWLSLFPSSCGLKWPGLAIHKWTSQELYTWQYTS